MQLPDIRTMVLVANLVALSMGLVFAVVVRVQRAADRAVAVWAAAFLCKSFGLFLIYLRQSIPDLVSYAVANTLVTISAQLFLAGIVVFVGRRPRWKGHAALAAGVLATLGVLFAGAGYAVAVTFVTVCIIALEAAAVRELIRRAPPGTGSAQQLVAFVFALDILLLTCRVAWLLSGPSSSSLFTPSLMTAIFYLDVILGTILLGTALLVLLYRRADLAKMETIAELQKALAEVRTLQGLLPICAWCKRIRDEDDTWHQVEKFVGSRTHARFSHSICPECAARFEHGAAADRTLAGDLSADRG